jgi:hypothetical protein
VEGGPNFRVTILPHFRGICHIFDDLATFFPHFLLLPHFATFFKLRENDKKQKNREKKSVKVSKNVNF